MKSGIYQIRNTVNDKLYIGQTINFQKRKTRHFWALKNNRHDNCHLQNAYNIYGLNSFMFSELAQCPKEELDITEQYLVDFYQPEYNICKDVVTSQLGIKRSQETKNKLSNSHRGKKLSIEHKASLSKAHTGLKQSLETIEKRMLKVRGIKKPQGLMMNLRKFSIKSVYQICPITQQIIAEHDSLSEAGKAVGISGDAIGNHLAGRSKSSGGFIWKFKNNSL